MNLRGVAADAAYVVRTSYRSRGSLVVTFALPVILLVTFGFIFTAPVAQQPLVLLDDQDGSPASARFAEVLAADGALSVVPRALPAGALATEWLAAEGAKAHVVLAPGFGADLDAGANATVSVLVRTGSDAEEHLVRALVASALARFNPQDVPGTARLHVDAVRVARDLPYATLLLPGVIGLSAMSVGLSMGFTSIAQLRTQGLLERLAVAPLRKSEWLFARMLGFTTISLAVTLFLVAVGVTFLGVRVHVSIWTVPIVVGGTLVFTGLGTVLGILTKRVESGGAILNLLIFPMVILSGSFFDVAGLPASIRWLPEFIPLKHVNDGLRADMIYADGGTAALYAGGLLLAAACVLIVGARLINWTED